MPSASAKEWAWKCQIPSVGSSCCSGWGRGAEGSARSDGWRAAAALGSPARLQYAAWSTCQSIQPRRCTPSDRFSLPAWPGAGEAAITPSPAPRSPSPRRRRRIPPGSPSLSSAVGTCQPFPDVPRDAALLSPSWACDNCPVNWNRSASLLRCPTGAEELLRVSPAQVPHCGHSSGSGEDPLQLMGLTGRHRRGPSGDPLHGSGGQDLSPAGVNPA